jgi:ABC-type antimicrobial peptide transport system permease subunit
MDAVLADSLGELNMVRWLVGVSAGLAAVLAAIGLYGVTSHAVTSRMRELAVRLALGSRPSALTTRVLGRAAALAVAGLLLGTPAVLALAPWTRSLSFPIRVEPDTYVAAAAGLIGVALLASLLPALRVSRVAPSQALRHD